MGAVSYKDYPSIFSRPRKADFVKMINSISDQNPYHFDVYRLFECALLNPSGIEAGRAQPFFYQIYKSTLFDFRDVTK